MKRTRHPAAVKGYGNIGPFKHIRCSRYNLKQTLLAYIQLADNQLVGIRVLIYLYYFAHNDLNHVFSNLFHSLKIGA